MATVTERYAAEVDEIAVASAEVVGAIGHHNPGIPTQRLTAMRRAVHLLMRDPPARGTEQRFRCDATGPQGLLLEAAVWAGLAPEEVRMPPRWAVTVVSGEVRVDDGLGDRREVATAVAVRSRQHLEPSAWSAAYWADFMRFQNPQLAELGFAPLVERTIERFEESLRDAVAAELIAHGRCDLTTLADAQGLLAESAAAAGIQTGMIRLPSFATTRATSRGVAVALMGRQVRTVDCPRERGVTAQLELA